MIRRHRHGAPVSGIDMSTRLIAIAAGDTYTTRDTLITVSITVIILKVTALIRGVADLLISLTFDLAMSVTRGETKPPGRAEWVHRIKRLIGELATIAVITVFI